MRIAVAWAFLLILGTANDAEAQLCIGAPSFQEHKYQLGAGATFTEGAGGVGGTFAAGGESLFGGGGLALFHFTDVATNSVNLSAFIGADLATSTARRVFVCPLVQFALGSGPDVDPLDVSTIAVRGGANVGLVVSDNDAMMVVPTLGVGATYQRLTAKFGGVDQSESNTSGVASVGVGFIFNRRVGITPELSIPFAARGSNVIFSVTLTFNFGG